MTEYIEENPSILALDAARANVRNHINSCGCVADMDEWQFNTLKELNAKVTECQNAAFEFHTVEIKHENSPDK